MMFLFLTKDDFKVLLIVGTTDFLDIINCFGTMLL